MKMTAMAASDDEPLPLLTLLRPDGEQGASLVVYRNLRLGLRLPGQEAWPTAWVDQLWQFWDPPSESKPSGRHHKPNVKLDTKAWHVVTLAVQLPRSIRIFLNGECVFDLNAEIDLPSEAAEAHSAPQEAYRAALRADGPMGFDPRSGLALFSDCTTASTLGGAKPEKFLRAFTLLMKQVRPLMSTDGHGWPRMTADDR